MAKVIAIVTDDFEDIELSAPKSALEAAGHTVDIVEKTAGKTITGKKGTTFKVDKSINDVKASDYDALLIPGGYSPDKLRTDERFVKLTREFLESDQLVFSICHGPQLFVQTGLVEQLKLTAVKQVQDDLRYIGATVLDQPVVFDDVHQLISSRTPDDMEEFTAAIVAALNK